MDATSYSIPKINVTGCMELTLGSISVPLPAAPKVELLSYCT